SSRGTVRQGGFGVRFHATEDSEPLLSGDVDSVDESSHGSAAAFRRQPPGADSAAFPHLDRRLLQPVRGASPPLISFAGPVLGAGRTKSEDDGKNQKARL